MVLTCRSHAYGRGDQFSEETRTPVTIFSSLKSWQKKTYNPDLRPKSLVLQLFWCKVRSFFFQACRGSERSQRRFRAPYTRALLRCRQVSWQQSLKIRLCIGACASHVCLCAAPRLRRPACLPNALLHRVYSRKYISCIESSEEMGGDETNRDALLFGLVGPVGRRLTARGRC